MTPEQEALLRSIAADWEGFGIGSAITTLLAERDALLAERDDLRADVERWEIASCGQ